jgi:UDP-N-acetylmuramate: L-alanyl-gamma-D-glutamyl-meso-diaminopimelate ligase
MAPAPAFLPPGSRIHLIGICGTAMASLAAMLKESGYQVTGSDSNVYPPMSTMLEHLGIAVKAPYSARNLEPRPDLIIVGNALSRGNPEVEEMLDQEITYESMAETVKRSFLNGRRSLVVAGTHGKTTTSFMLAWILEVAGESDPKFRPGFLIGGMPENFPAGFRTQPEPGGYFVIEGDEYDTAFFDKGPKFLHYQPRTLLLTSVEYDHADIYADLESVKVAFRRLVNLVPASGVIIASESAGVGDCLGKAYCPVERYGTSTTCHWRAEHIETYEDWTRFEVFRGKDRYMRVDLKAAGDHNVMNAVGALAMAANLGVSDRLIRQALGTFQGVKRRMEVRGEANGIIVVDDFAHHPTAVRETIRGMRKRFPGKNIWVILEPRSNTLRRRAFEAELTEALAEADRVTLAAVYHGEAIPDQERLETGRVVMRLLREGLKASTFTTVQEIVSHTVANAKKGDVLLIMSNGGFEGIHQKLLDKLG